MNKNRFISRRFFYNYMWLGLLLASGSSLAGYFNLKLFWIVIVLWFLWAAGVFAMVGFVRLNEDENENGNG